MSIQYGPKINGVPNGLLYTAANGDTYGDAERKLFRGIQTLVMPNVISMAVAAQPGAPAFGDTYVLPTGATGAAWATNDKKIAFWAIDNQDGVVTTGAWEFYTPLAGWVVYDNNTGAAWRYNGTSWVLGNIAQRKITNATANGALALDASQGNTFYNTLSNNVTSVTISNPTDAQIITLIWNQGGTAYTVSYTGSTFRGATAIGATINKSTIQQFQYDLATTSWLGVAAAQINI